MSLVEKIFGSFSDRELKKINPIAKKVLDLEPTYAAMSDSELQAQTPALKDRLAKGETLDDILPEAFATCREAAWRVLGMKHFPVQVVGGIALHRANIAEMQTGEGKTLVATLPAYLNALSGEGVHVVTVNDYLAKRDSEWMGKLYRWLGLTVGLIVPGLDGAARRKAYNADITYGTNNEFGFDYLRDNMVTYKANMVQRGHAYAIVDEVDSILIDEARTPLIISGRGEDSSSLYSQVDQFVRTLRKSVVVELESKEEADDQADGDYVVDEKHKTATLTASGIKKAEDYFKVENLAAAENMTLVHHIEQAIKAHGVMKKDIDYVVKDGQVIIVDEFTGRLMYGRRYNEGLHQAIEAKEGVTVANESKTLATITFQNFFRLYAKLSGMTGTALTEAEEFMGIYDLDVIEIPTNKPVARIDHPDVVYKTEAGKFRAVIRQIEECHRKGQPVLVGTISIEKSEVLSKMLKKEGIPHNVLNAKHHEKEAEIVAQAGKLGAVTIATNMAGRGTDIMLGGNAEYLALNDLRKSGMAEELIVEANAYSETEDPAILEARQAYQQAYEAHKVETNREAEQVRAAGGLFIVGTERHESRRIDNQLRGRSGRQGDPGETRFYLSMEDDVMRLFGSDRIKGMMETMGLDEDTPIDAKILSGAIENAQKNVESRNYQTRKNVLEYDDVMNTQRQVIYGQRSQVLDGEDLQSQVAHMMELVAERHVHAAFGEQPHISHSDFLTLASHFENICYPKGGWTYTDEQLATLTREQAQADLLQKMQDFYAKKEAALTAPVMRELERVVTLRVVDEYWMDHLDAMTDLRQGIGLRAYGQTDPVVEYKREGYEMFEAMIDAIREEIVRRMFLVQIKPQTEIKREKVAKITSEGGAGDKTVKRQPTVRKAKVGRNDPCPCGSGKKYKNCCLDKDLAGK